VENTKKENKRILNSARCYWYNSKADNYILGIC